jgi:hypothetical protein
MAHCIAAILNSSKKIINVLLVVMVYLWLLAPHAEKQILTSDRPDWFMGPRTLRLVPETQQAPIKLEHVCCS